MPKREQRAAHLHRLVEDAAADLHHLEVLLLLVPSALDVGHPAALILLAGVDEIAHGSVFVKHLRERKKFPTVRCEALSVVVVVAFLFTSQTRSERRRRTTHLPHKVVVL